MADGADGAAGVLEDEANKYKEEKVVKENVGDIAVASSYEEAKASIEQYEVATTTKFYCYKRDKAFLDEGNFKKKVGVGLAC